MEVDCYCNCERETINIHITDLFGEDAEKVIARMSKYDRIIIHDSEGAKVVINMAMVTYVEPSESSLEFHFLNEGRLIINSNEKIEYVSAEYHSPYYVLSSREEEESR